MFDDLLNLKDGSKPPKMTSKEVFLSSDEEDERESSKINQAMPLLNDVPSKMTVEEEVYLLSHDEEGQQKSKIIEALPLLDDVCILALHTPNTLGVICFTSFNFCLNQFLVVHLFR